ncbi:hypothetical protein J7T55_007454 [Diaporthe amygdali]|uniref:uncharacterized protein n=1 Tax=Phomopsis amygdali TaxID=1214568 RepID=UPI0022FE20DD|nr:uncharacterized protein J7T55_007454 [Diaporthe amygdali]KAJ0116474.1 hypothetical protein J7T55_007454 [Diaporthe amygdali]
MPHTDSSTTVPAGEALLAGLTAITWEWSWKRTAESTPCWGWASTPSENHEPRHWQKQNAATKAEAPGLGLAMHVLLDSIVRFRVSALRHQPALYLVRLYPLHQLWPDRKARYTAVTAMSNETPRTPGAIEKASQGGCGKG